MMSGKELSEGAAAKYLRGRDHTTVEEIALAVAGVTASELRAVQRAIIVAQLEPNR